MEEKQTFKNVMQLLCHLVIDSPISVILYIRIGFSVCGWGSPIEWRVPSSHMFLPAY